ncbi:hypothetical protein GCM10007940_33240 [Portibacter lacus]|uniref:Glycosyltransferase 2-like domain-containing protein n=1 Tax=Portibacter lacus TaxID=1099794 RepID=A0AA37SV53_9BACT|nr:hypothetical protein GCM10007940_33240 [Portibacter lacus]
MIDQKFTDWELIIVDDGSTDLTREVVQEFKDDRIKYIFQEHLERSSARNHGIDVANGRYVCFIDDDDLITTDYLNDFYQHYESRDFPETILRTGFVRKIKEKSITTTNYDQKKHKNPVNYAAYHMCGVWSLSIPSRFLEVDRFPVDFPHWQDTHLILRLLMKHPFVQLSNYNYIYQIHEEMGSKKATLDFDPLERAELNVAAFDDLFSAEGKNLAKYLKKNTLSFLKAEKYIQYAVASIAPNRTQSRLIFQKSINSGIYVSLYKNYILYIVNYIKYIK